MLLSQNGWQVLIREELVWFTAAGGSFAAANQDVAYCAAYLINQFDTRVEKIPGVILDDWSWASRPIRGQDRGYSNHASATAWDLNATQHQRGAKHTFSDAQIAEITKIVNSIEDDRGMRIFRWGGSYVHALEDDMHFEINVSPEHVKAGAQKLKALLKGKEMEWSDKVKLTATDAAALAGSHKANDLVSIGELLRYPPGVLRVEAEIKSLQAFAKSTTEQIATLQSALTALNTNIASLTSAINRAVPIPEVPPHA